MNKKNLIFTLFVFLPFLVLSQCREFTNNIAIPLLKDFLLTGRYHSMELQEGDEILIFKTLNRNILYRFVVVSSDNIPQPHFIIADWNDNIIYDNAKNNYNPIFDFKSTKAQRIKIRIKIPVKSPPDQQPKQGCVALVIGMKKL